MNIIFSLLLVFNTQMDAQTVVNFTDNVIIHLENIKIEQWRKDKMNKESYCIKIKNIDFIVRFDDLEVYDGKFKTVYLNQGQRDRVTKLYYKINDYHSKKEYRDYLLFLESLVRTLKGL